MNFQYISVLSFKIDNFAKLASTLRSFGAIQASRAMSVSGMWKESSWATCCHGTSWRLRVCRSSGTRHYSLIIDKEEQEDGEPGVESKLSIIVRDLKGNVVKETLIKSAEVVVLCEDAIEKDKVLDKDSLILVGGALHIDLIIQQEDKVKCSRVSSQDMLLNNILKLLETEDMADLYFKFSDNSSIYAHSFILAVNAPLLSSLFVGDATYISIEGTSSRVFRCILRYIYGGGPPEMSFLLEHGMDIIDAANKFGVLGLKLEAEEALVAAKIVDIDNVVEYFKFADSLNCALLKEYAMSVYAARSKDMIGKESFIELATESPRLLQELMESSVDRTKIVPVDDGSFQTMPVTTLRQKLKELGLEIDGSKEMLVSRLEASS